MMKTTAFKACPTWANAIALVLLYCGSVQGQIEFERITAAPFADDIHRSFGCSWADYDNDSWEDLFVINGYGRNNCLYRNNGDGTFTKVTAGPVVNDGGDSCAGVWADFDNDGDLDLFVTNFDPPDDFFYLNHGGEFTQVRQGPWVNDGVASNHASWADYDADGYVDLLVVTPFGNGDLLYRNTGAGTVERVTQGPVVSSGGTGIGCAWADYDNDGDLDLYVANAANGELNFLFRNEGQGCFTRVTDGPLVTDVCESLGTRWADYDNDGDLDLFVAEMDPPNSLFRNEGNGLFTRIEEGDVIWGDGNCREPVWADFDNDGYLDLFVTSAFGTGNLLFRNQRNGQFERVFDGVVATDLAESHGAAVADYDHDGYLDLCVVNGGLGAAAENFLYRNHGGANRWIHVRLIGTVSNRSAIGVKIRVKATIWGAEIWQLRQLSGGEGYYGQNSLLTHFGLGDATRVDLLRIEWPSGIVQELKDVAAQQILTVTEPARLIPQSAGGFQVQSWLNQSFEVQASTDLADWSPVASITNLTGTLVFQDPGSSPGGCRYYRVTAR